MTATNFIASLIAATTFAVAAPVLAGEPAPEVVAAAQAIEDGFDVDVSPEARARRAETREIVLEARIGEAAYEARLADKASKAARAKRAAKIK